MSLTTESGIRQVNGITSEERRRITDFLQGSVYCWCKNREAEWFSLRDLMGGENYSWKGTPLQKLYDKHAGDQSNPVEEAGKDAGWLLKKVVADDVRKFDTKIEAQTRQYRWVPNENDT